MKQMRKIKAGNLTCSRWLSWSSDCKSASFTTLMVSLGLRCVIFHKFLSHSKHSRKISLHRDHFLTIKLPTGHCAGRSCASLDQKILLVSGSSLLKHLLLFFWMLPLISSILFLSSFTFPLPFLSLPVKRLSCFKLHKRVIIYLKEVFAFIST